MSRWLLIALLGASACTEPRRVPRDGGKEVPDCKTQPEDDACDNASRDNVMFTWAQSVCTLLLECCSTSDRTNVASQFFGDDGVALLSIKEPAFLNDQLSCRRAVAWRT